MDEDDNEIMIVAEAGEGEKDDEIELEQEVVLSSLLVKVMKQSEIMPDDGMNNEKLF